MKPVWQGCKATPSPELAIERKTASSIIGHTPRFMAFHANKVFFRRIAEYAAPPGGLVSPFYSSTMTTYA
jgi:hypothetical protein